MRNYECYRGELGPLGHYFREHAAPLLQPKVRDAEKILGPTTLAAGPKERRGNEELLI